MDRGDLGHHPTKHRRIMSTTVNITETVNLVTLKVTEDGESTTINIKDNVGPQGPQGPAGAGFLGNGFIDYNNTDSPTSITADTWTTLPNDGLGAFSNSIYNLWEISVNTT